MSRYGVYPSHGHYGSGEFVSPISTHATPEAAAKAASTARGYRVVDDTRRIRGHVLDKLPSVASR